MKDRVCILPVMETEFHGQEYLGLYPYLEYVSHYQDKGVFYVINQKSTWKKVNLSEWLKGQDPK